MTDSRDREHPDVHEGDPIDDACRSIDDKKSVDWSLTDSKVSNARDQASARALRDLERIAEVHRAFQKPPEPGSPGRPQVSQPEPWGHLSILELARTGTSGEVWRAWDTWLQREVALKFLVTTDRGASNDSVLLDEARSLARIRHPGVVNVYGIGSHAGRVGMWMEFLPGATLEGEIDRRGPLPSPEVTRIGRGLCRALDAVVAAGLVHRDIKPANIVLEPNGRAVLTDFGLGKRASVTDREAWRSSGTPLFMAPELLAGEAATPRSDLYALGVTLRWALTGRAPFQARSLQDLRTEAEAGPSTRLQDERPDAPPALVAAIERAMAPRPDARFATPLQFAEALEAIVPGQRTAARPSRWLAAGAGAIAAGVLALLFARHLPNRNSPPGGHFTIQAPPQTVLSPYAGGRAISPDGRHLAFVAYEDTTGARIWLRRLDALAARPVEGSEAATFLFWSPDSKELGFFAGGKLKKVAIHSGPPEVICDAPDPRGGTWGKDGVILFAPQPAGGLYRVSSKGGTPIEILGPDSTSQETALRWPQFLPDGKRFFFVSLPPKKDEFDLFVSASDSPGRVRVMQVGCAPAVAGDRGIVFSHDGRVVIQGFDYRRLRPEGTPVVLATVPFTNPSVGQPLASASWNGIIVHLHEPLSRTEVIFRDRSGRHRGGIAMPPGRYEWAFSSPDGQRLLIGKRDSPTSVEIWLADLSLGQSRRFSMGSQTRVGGQPTWSPDGSRIAFSSDRTGPNNIYERSVDEAGEEKLLYASDGAFKEVTAWSPDGEYLVFERADPKTGWDLWLLPMKRKEAATPYLASRFNEVGGTISPDGKWLAYMGNLSGKVEVYVRSFPKPGAEVRIFEGEGRADWSRDGREIVISHTNDGKVWAVPVSTVPTFRAGAPQPLFRIDPEAKWVEPAPDGVRFLEVRPVKPMEAPSIGVHMNVRRP